MARRRTTRPPGRGSSSQALTRARALACVPLGTWPRPASGLGGNGAPASRRRGSRTAGAAGRPRAAGWRAAVAAGRRRRAGRRRVHARLVGHRHDPGVHGAGVAGRVGDDEPQPLRAVGHLRGCRRRPSRGAPAGTAGGGRHGSAPAGSSAPMAMPPRLTPMWRTPESLVGGAQLERLDAGVRPTRGQRSAGRRRSDRLTPRARRSCPRSSSKWAGQLHQPGPLSGEHQVAN